MWFQIAHLVTPTHLHTHCDSTFSSKWTFENMYGHIHMYYMYIFTYIYDKPLVASGLLRICMYIYICIICIYIHVFISYVISPSMCFAWLAFHLSSCMFVSCAYVYETETVTPKSSTLNPSYINPKS